MSGIGESYWYKINTAFAIIFDVLLKLIYLWSRLCNGFWNFDIDDFKRKSRAQNVNFGYHTINTMYDITKLYDQVFL